MTSTLTKDNAMESGPKRERAEAGLAGLTISVNPAYYPSKMARTHSFGTHLRDLRRSRGVGVKALARAVKVNVAYISRIERGLSPASEAVIRRLAKVLGVSVEPLLIASGHLPPDIRQIFAEYPFEAALALREEFAPNGRFPERGSPLPHETGPREPGSFAVALVALRQKLGITREELASRLSSKPSAILRWETGTAKPSLEQLERLSRLGLAAPRTSWSNAESIPRRRLVAPRENLPLFPSQEEFPQAFEMDSDSVLREGVRKTLVIGRKELPFSPSPYVLNGPADQLPFFETLYDLQVEGSHQWPVSELPIFIDRLSSIATITDKGGTCSIAQHRLEAPRPDSIHWNPNYGSHGWHRYVGRFPPHLIRALLNYFGANSADLVFDPFLGSGTTLVECRLMGIPGLGVEICPLSAAISEVKSRFPLESESIRQLLPGLASLYRNKYAGVLSALAGHTLTHSDVLKQDWNIVPHFPNLEQWLTPSALLGVSIVLAYAGTLSDPYLRQSVLVALSSRMRSIGNVDVDVVRAEYSARPRENVDVLRLVSRTLANYAASIDDMARSHAQTIGVPGSVRVENADSRTFSLGEKMVSYVITSPPYGVETISYLRTHLLSYRCLAAYLRSDPYKFGALVIGSEYVDDSKTSATAEIEEIDSPIARQFFTDFLSTDPPLKLLVRARCMRRFFLDMQDTIRAMWRYTRPRGKVAFVIGNKKLGDWIIPTADIITDLFSSAGFQFERAIQHKLKCNNSNSQVPWQDRIIQEEYVLIYSKP